MNDITNLLLQILMVILPIFVYQTFWGEKKMAEGTEKGRMNEFFLWFFSLSFCMFLPTFLTHEFRFDLRLIPITAGFLYSGYAIGTLLTLISVVYRIYLGGILGIYHYVLVLSFYIPVVLYAIQWYRHADRKKRTRIFILLSLYPYICSIFALFFLGDIDFVKINFTADLYYYLSVMYITSWFTVFLLENLRENRQIRMELQQAEKMKILRDLTSVFAHEIRNPMQVTRGFLQLLDTPDLPNEKKNYIQISIEELDRANEIISEFLSLAKPAKEGNQRVEVGNHLLRVINMIQTYASAQNVSIQTNLTDDCWIFAHPQKFNQCLINILKNAIESMPNGGTVSVHCYPSKNGYIAIDIQDHGVGMTKEQMQRLGSPYYSLKEKGTGIGLMVSYQIIQSFQGKVKVKSEKEKGTRFSIYLPKIDHN